MAIPTPHGRDGPARAPLLRIGRWPFWTLSRQAMLFLSLTDILSVVLGGAASRHGHLAGADIGRLVLLVGLSAGYAEATDRVARVRNYLGTDRGVMASQNSVVCFAGVLVLPITGALLLTAAVYTHTFIRGQRHQSIKPYRQTFVTATELLGTLAAAEVYQRFDGQLRYIGPVDAALIVLTLLTYTLTSLAVLLTGMCLALRPPSWHALLPNLHEATFELSTLILGVLGGVIALRAPWLFPLTFALAAVLHRSSLVRQLQTAASTDGKTGLLNAGAWRQLAEQELARSERANAPVALLLIDLDHFKAVNDNHGHLIGDVVLTMVGHALKTELRGHDAVGRYGGEEFVVLLPEVDAPAAAEIADRVRGCIAALEPGDGIRVTASIGLAQRAASGGGLDRLIHDADTALYQAKALGRDRVSTSSRESPAIRVRRDRASP